MEAQLNEGTNLSAAEQRDALLEKMITGMTGFFLHNTIYIGYRLGYYDTLARHENLTSTELAEITATNERYTREWLEQQTVYGIIQVLDPLSGPHERKFSLLEGHAEVLTDPNSLNFFAPISRLMVGVTRPMDAILDAFRTGNGVTMDQYGEDMREGQAAANRATFLREIGQVWIPAMPDIEDRLKKPGARIADIGCGYGWSSIGMSLAYPQAQVDGFDLDAPSIDKARNNARDYDLNSRVSFHVQDAADHALVGHYDLVTAFECVHDMSDPVGALRTMRRLINGTGGVLIADERVGDTFTSEGNEIEAIMYGWSVLHCLPVGMTEQPSAATGTVMRTDTLRGYALAAGFRDVEVLPVDNFFFRLYRLIP
jgi:2-polyprenyl-3-methyl-5-hydroxy-6-metoxy-1,4-benzoquinol methylase